MAPVFAFAKNRRILAGIIFVGAVLCVVALWAGKSGAHKELQEYKRGLRARGEKLTYAEITAGRGTNASDCAAVISNALVSLRDAAFTPGSLELRSFVGPGRASACWNEALPRFSGAGRRPNWEQLLGQFADSAAALAMIRAVLTNPPPDAGPMVEPWIGPRVNFVSIRSSAQWLAAAAICDLHQGNNEAALQNLEALGAVASMYSQEYTLVAQMIRVSVTGLGLSATWEALQAPGWTEPQLERLQRTWAGIDLLAALETGFVSERAMGEAAFELVRSPKGRRIFFVIGRSAGKVRLGDRLEWLAQDYVLLPLYKVTSIDADELFYLQTIQHGIEATSLLKSGRPWAEAKATISGGISNLNRLGGSSTAFRARHWLSAVTIPNYSKASETVARVETERRLTIAAIALERFRLKHGKYPGLLADLVPGMISAVPADPMSGQSLGYATAADGSFVLYSVGEDSKDDGGDPRSGSSAKFGMWDGLDAVWPAAAR